MMITDMKIVVKMGIFAVLLTASLRKGLRILNQDESQEGGRIFLYFSVGVTLYSYFIFQQFELISSLCVNVGG